MKKLVCSFCGKDSEQVKLLIEGQTSTIIAVNTTINGEETRILTHTVTPYMCNECFDMACTMFKPSDRKH